METKLPVEIIEQILCFESVSISDAINFSLTNRYYNNTIRNSTTIWRKKYFQNWPQFDEIFDDNLQYDWYAELRYIYDLKPRIPEILSTMASRFLNQYMLSDSDFTEWLELYQQKPQTYYYLVEDLLSIVANTHPPIDGIKVVPITTPGNKTLQYYAMKVLRYLRHMHLIKEWEGLLASPKRLQTLERLVVFTTNWFKPHANVSCKTFSAKLDELAEKVKKYLDERIYTNRPSLVLRKVGRHEIFEKNEYSVAQSTLIARTVDELTARYETDGGIVRQVMRNGGEKFALMSVHEGVARRFGVNYEPTIYMKRLRGQDSERNKHDCFRNDMRLCDPHLVIFGLRVAVATTQKVIQCVAKEILAHSHHIEFGSKFLNTRDVVRTRSCLEFYQLIYPSDEYTKKILAGYYMEHNMDTTSFIDSLKKQRTKTTTSIIKMLEEYEADRNRKNALITKAETKIRPPHLKYAVGMVMNMSFFNKRTCVICDWSSTSSDQQPLYEVLTEDGHYNSVAQDNLEPSKDTTASLHFLKDFGRHFSHRFQTIVVPNAAKEKQYPADTAVRNMHNQKMMSAASNIPLKRAKTM